MAKTIALSAGHGAGDSGAVYGGLREDNLTKLITRRAVAIVRAHGIDCLDVPDDLTLKQTIDWINHRASQITICVEVHINSGGGTGVEAWNYVGGINESDKLSQSLANALADETGLRNRGAKDESLNRHGVLGFVHDTKPVAALAECGFIDGDYAFLNSAAGIEKMARGIARGSLAYIGINWNPALLNPTPTPSPTTDAQKIQELKKLIWYDNAWWNSLYRVKEMRKILPK